MMSVDSLSREGKVKSPRGTAHHVLSRFQVQRLGFLHTPRCQLSIHRSSPLMLPRLVVYYYMINMSIVSSVMDDILLIIQLSF